MTSRIQITAPATIAALAGTAGISSLGEFPPDLTVTDPNSAGTITVTLIAANAAAVLDAGSAGGATISTTNNTLAITGDMAQVNAALATLQLFEAAGATADTIFITASDPAVLAAQTAIAVDVTPDTGPAFANPPARVTLAPNAVDALPGLIIGDPQLAGLDAAGQGGAEACALTLAAASGILLLPGFSALAGVSADGLGTGTIVLDFLADQLGIVNGLLAGLEFAGPAATSGLAYSLRYVAGSLPAASTSGDIVLDIAGTAGANGTYAAGDQSLILGTTALSAGSTITITTAAGDLGGIGGAGAVIVAPDAALNLPYNNLSLGGTSLDFGTLAAVNLAETGALVITDSATFAGGVTLGPGAAADFAGNLIAGNTDQVVNELAFSLGAGALLTGDGTLIAGNFSESGRISGAGTILAQAGETILIAAGSIGAGAVLEAAAGGVMVLGPVAPLYGVFNATPLTIDSSVTLDFSGLPGESSITGPYGDALDQSGGVFVINGPQAFGGSITGFSPGDRLIFPGLSNVSLLDITDQSFEVGGQNSAGTMVFYQIDAPYPAGSSVYASIDNEGDAEIGLRDSAIQLYLGGVSIAVAEIGASSGIAQPIQGFSLLPPASTTLSLTVTLSVGAGVLAVGGESPAATITITAPNLVALNAELAGLSYTGTGPSAVMTVSSGTGVLAGLSATAFIDPVAPGTVSSFAGVLSEGETADFSAASATPNPADAAVGRLILSATNVFAGSLILDGISGTALEIDGGATGVFDAAAAVTTGADVTVGDAGGAGTLAIISDDFSIGGNGATANLTLAARAAGAGSTAEIAGTLGISGELIIGAAAGAVLDLSGNLGAAVSSLGGAGTLFAYAGAVAALGTVSDAGTMTFTDQAVASAASITLPGKLAIGGVATLHDAGGLFVSGNGVLDIGPDASFAAALATMSGGTIAAAGALSLGTLLSGGGFVTLTGGSIAAAGFTIGSASTLAGFGVLAPTASINNRGTIAAAGGELLVGGPVGNLGVLDIGTAAVLDLAGAANGAVAFTGTAAELIINDAGGFAAGVSGFAGSDVIDLVGILPAQASFAAGTVTATDTAGNRLGAFALTVNGGPPAISIVSDGAGGALITLGDEMPCFSRGTGLLTPAGYRPVDVLCPGDDLITAAGDRRPIRWIGRRTVDFAASRSRIAWPVLIMPNAFGPGQPARPLRLSPLHAVFRNGVLVPAAHLVNGATIQREQAAAATYYHVELDRHDIIFAEGLTCETYLDTGNRGALYDEAGTRTPARRACAKLVIGGAKLAAIRRELHERALAAGFSLTYQPALRAIADNQPVLPDILRRGRRRMARLAWPVAARRVVLLSRCASPAETDPDSEDRRELALCLGAARAQGKRPALGEGWLPRAAADGGFWMGRRAELLLRQPADRLTLSLAAVIRTWRPAGAGEALDGPE